MESHRSIVSSQSHHQPRHLAGHPRFHNSDHPPCPAQNHSSVVVLVAQAREWETRAQVWETKVQVWETKAQVWETTAQVLAAEGKE